MAEYIIPKYKIEELQKKIQRIKNKGAEIIFDIIDEDIPYEYTDESGRTKYIACDRVQVSGEYKINGWTFVATIEHAEPENIIRVANTELEDRIPEKYRHVGRECEHCHIRRDRNDTYLVYNEDYDEWKQVGRTCLAGYTNGLNSENCARLVEVIREINKLNDDSINGVFDHEYASSNYTYLMDDVKKKAYKFVERNGYQSDGITAHEFRVKLTTGELDDEPEATDEEVNAVQEYLENEEQSGYIRNALAVWTKRIFEGRDAGLVTSAVYSYFRNRQKIAQRQAKEAQRQAELANVNQTAAGQVGDKVEFEVADSKVLYMKSSGSYYGGDYPVYRIVGTDGRIYIWACANGTEINQGLRLRGTIKKISEFRGETQTEVTRCKVVEALSETPQRSVFAGLRSLDD